MAEPFANVASAARALLMRPDAKFNRKTGQFLGGVMFDHEPQSEKQMVWLTDLLRKAGLPPIAEGGNA